MWAFHFPLAILSFQRIKLTFQMHTVHHFLLLRATLNLYLFYLKIAVASHMRTALATIKSMLKTETWKMFTSLLIYNLLFRHNNSSVIPVLSMQQIFSRKPLFLIWWEWLFRLMYLNTCSPGDRTLWEGLGVVVLLGKSILLGIGFEMSKVHTIPS